MAIKVTGSRRPGIPPYVGVPVSSSHGLRPGHFGATYLGSQHNPFDTGGDPSHADFQVKNLTPPPGMTIRRLDDREGLRKKFDQWHRKLGETHAFDAMDRFDQQAFELTAGSTAREAFDISLEDPSVRDRYGRNNWGQSALLARRLVEAGSTFVTLHFGGWDQHWNLEGAMNVKLPRVDAAVSSLLVDLEDRGLRDQVLVVVCGEFSRTPQMNNGQGSVTGKGTPGRDHWPNSMSVLLSGGGLRMGQVIGATNRRAEEPVRRIMNSNCLLSTVYNRFGIDADHAYYDNTGRPVPILTDGEPISELL